jgi:beta-glucosidase
VASVVRPAKLLVRFEKIVLTRGETRTVSFTLNPRLDLSFTGAEMQRVCEVGEFELMIGSSSEDIRATNRFRLR